MGLFDKLKRKNRTNESIYEDNTEISFTKTGNLLFDICFENMEALSSKLRISNSEEKISIFKGLFIAGATALEESPIGNKKYDDYLKENKNNFELVDSRAKLRKGQTLTSFSDANADYLFIKTVTMDMTSPFSFEMKKGIIAGLFCAREIVKDEIINTLIDAMFDCSRKVCLDTIPNEVAEDLLSPRLQKSDREMITQRYKLFLKAAQGTNTKSNNTGVVDTKKIAELCASKLLKVEEDFCDYIMHTYYVQTSKGRVLGFLNEELQAAIKEIAFKQQGVKLTIISILEQAGGLLPQKYESYTMIRRVLEQCNCKSFEDVLGATGLLLSESILDLTFERDSFLQAYAGYHQIVVDILKDEIKPNGLGNCKYIQLTI